MNRPPRNTPVDPPAGYRWHLDVDTWRNVGVGVLMLVDEAAYVSKPGGMLWIDAVPAGKKKPKPRPYFPRGSRDIDRESQVRRRSRAIVREHYRLAAQEHSSALAAARITDAIQKG